MIVFSYRAVVGRKKLLLHECRGIKDPEVTVRVRRWLFNRELVLTHDTKRAIAEFLVDHSKSDNSFDCYAFANLVGNVTPHSMRYLLKFWDMEPLTGEPQIGETIFLVTRHKQRFHHAAIYLGYGIYISVYGSGGDLEFATLEDMKRDYVAADIVRAKPRT